jgi:hypothetical protein
MPGMHDEYEARVGAERDRGQRHVVVPADWAHTHAAARLITRNGLLAGRRFGID